MMWVCQYRWGLKQETSSLELLFIIIFCLLVLVGVNMESMKSGKSYIKIIVKKKKIMAVFLQGTWPILYLELSSSQKMIMVAAGKKKKKKKETCTVYLKRSPRSTQKKKKRRGVHVLLFFYKWLLPLCIPKVLS